MNLIEKFNISSCHESTMQKSVATQMALKEFRQQKSRWIVDYIKPKVYMEVSIPEVSRRSDIIVRVSDRKIFNIECKLNNIDEVINQALDHQLWCDYSYVCLHAGTYIPSYQIHKMVKSGLGLMLWQDHHDWGRMPREESMMDVFGAYKSKRIDKNIRKRVLQRLRKYEALLTSGKDSQQKLQL